MTITAFANPLTVGIIFGVIIFGVIIGAVIIHFSKDPKSVETDEKVSLKEIPIALFDLLMKVEPIQSHVKKLNEASRTIQILKKAIIKNLSDNGYKVTSIWYQMYNGTSLPDLPDILELQNIFSLKPIIKDLEDLYKRLDNAKNIEDTESEWVRGMMYRLRDILCNDEEFQRLASANLIKSYDDRHLPIFSSEAKEIVDRAINKAKES